MAEPLRTNEALADILSVASALAPAVPQTKVAEAVAGHYTGAEPRYLAMFDNAGITTRRLVRPPTWYTHEHSLAERGDLAVVEGTRLASDAAAAALARSGCDPGAVDAVVVATSTVLRSPGLDLALQAGLGLRPDVRRVTVGAMASLGGANALALGADLVAAGYQRVLVVVVEVNSLTFSPGRATGDRRATGTPAEFATLALFSDGAAAVVLGPAGGGGSMQVVGRHAEVVPDTLGVMGFDLDDAGLRWRLAPDVPDVAARQVAASVGSAASRVGWDPDGIDHLLVHPGGVRVLDAVEGALGLGDGRLGLSRAVLGDCGNLSGPTVLVVLERHFTAGPPGGTAMLVAMGPGFGFEHVALVAS